MTSDGRKRSYGKLAKIGMLWGFMREGGNFFLMLPAAMIIARLLSPQEAGIAAAAAFVTQLCSRLTQFGFGQALVRTKHITPAHISSVFFVNLGLGIAGWGVLTLAAPTAGVFFDNAAIPGVVRLSAFGFIIMAFGSIPTAILSREMRYREGAMSEWLSTITEMTVAIVLAWKGYSYWSLVWGRLAGDTARMIWRSWMVRWRPTLQFSRAAMHEMLSFGVGNYVNHILDFSAKNLDNLVVGKVLGMTALGFYDKAFTTVHRFTAKINLAGPSVSFRIFSLIHEDRERFRRAYRKVILSVTLVGYPVLTGMIVTAPEFIEVMFGSRWLPAVPAFQILCVANLLRILNIYAATATQAKGQIWPEVKRKALFTVVLVAAVWAFSPWGIAGAATGVLVSTVAMTVMLQSLVQRMAKLRWRDLVEPQVPAIICAAGLALVLVVTRVFVRGWVGPNPSALLLFASCVTAAGLYYGAFLLAVPIAAVRAVVSETAHDLVPGLARRVPWLAAGEKKAAALSTP